MTFKIIDNPEFTIDVTVPMPGDLEAQVLKATFRGISEEEIDAYNLFDTTSTKDMLRRIVVAFHDVEGDDGAAVAHVDPGKYEQLYEKILGQPNVRVALQTAYAREMMGVKGKRRGN